MPITPFHFGPGAAIKAVAPRHFSLSTFVLTQVLIDMESLYNIVYSNWPVHAFFHTYVGVTLAAVVAMLTGRFVLDALLRALNPSIKLDSESPPVPIPCAISWRSAAGGAFIGAYSHVFLDSIMHPDIEPLSPFSSANALYHVVSVPMLHVLCFVAGLIGGIWLLHLLLIGRYRAG